MEKRILNYIKYMREFVSKEHTKSEYEKAYADLMIQISFFQHERLIHLIVTITFALLTIISLVACLFVMNVGLLFTISFFSKAS